MQKAILKISSILLCGLLIYNSLGYFLVISVMRMAIHQQKWTQLTNLPDEELTVFVFAKNNTDARLKIVDDHEIIVDGKLYDIIRKTEARMQIKYFCKYDHEEEALIVKTRLFNSQAQQMPLQNTAKLIIDKIIKTGIINETTELFSGSFNVPFINFIESHYLMPAIQIASPPPQSSC